MEKPTQAEIQYQEYHILDSQAHAVLVACVVCYTLASVAVLFRILSRRLAKAVLAKDDYMIFLALVSIPQWSMLQSATIAGYDDDKTYDWPELL